MRRARGDCSRTCPSTTSPIRRARTPTIPSTGPRRRAAAAVPGAADRVVRRADRHRRRARRATPSSSSAPRYAPTWSPVSGASTAARSASSPTSPCSGRARSTSRRRARPRGSSQWCDAFNLPIVTFVDTPGFEPGTRPRVARHDPPRRRARARVRRGHRAADLRRAAQGVRRRVHRDGLARHRQRRTASRGRRRRDRGDGRAAGACRSSTAGGCGHRRPDERAPRSRPSWWPSTRTASLNPYVAAERGYVDAVIDPADTRRVLARRARRASAPSATDGQPRRRTRNSDRSTVPPGSSQEGPAMLLARQAHPRDRRAQRRVDRLLDGRLRAGGGRRGRADVVRAGDEPHRARRPAAARPRRADRRARRHRARTTSPRSAGNVGGTLDGVLHAIGFAPESCLGGGFLDRPWEDVAVALQVSAYSLKALAGRVPAADGPGRLDRGPRLRQRRVAWPVYDWMGVAKAAFESTARVPRPRPRTTTASA